MSITLKPIDDINEIALFILTMPFLVYAIYGLIKLMILIYKVKLRKVK